MPINTLNIRPRPTPPEISKAQIREWFGSDYNSLLSFVHQVVNKKISVTIIAKQLREKNVELEVQMETEMEVVTEA